MTAALVVLRGVRRRAYNRRMAHQQTRLVLTLAAALLCLVPTLRAGDDWRVGVRAGLVQPGDVLKVISISPVAVAETVSN